MGWRAEGLAVVVVLVGCGGASADDASDTDTVSDTDTTDDTDTVVDDTASRCALLTWDTVGGPFTRTWCTPCHASELRGDARSGAPVAFDFDTVEDVLRQAQVIRDVATGPSPIMPPVGGPTDAERARMLAWLDCETGG
ncbi:MAG: hypothetical protein H6733_08800 [Alphaproteobacteria bacterium]|nr:hypothetical protein [Alphaproteobacteria bacterium]